jgi:acyl transferase domain-containing protein/3-hydroxymyristoyl/3-hydroxydecanoyl-(acyl carrier protein) dehydratase
MNFRNPLPERDIDLPNEPIAIVGMGLVFPGADTPEAFWDLVVSGRCMAGAITDDRWPVAPRRLFDPGEIRADAVYGLSACLVPSAWRPNAHGIVWPEGIDAATLDPVFAMAVHAAAGAWTSSRHASVDRSRVSVILGNIALPTESTAEWSQELFSWEMARRQGRPRPLREPNPWNRDPVALPAKLISAALRLGGRSFTLDAACASSLYALRLAMDELRRGDADAVLAGGLSRPDCLYTQMGFAQLRALSRAGVPRPFDERGDGLVVGEGAGVFLLKRLSDAVAQGDRILGVLRSVGLSNDISGALLAPSSEGQLRAMTAAYAEAGLDPEAIDAIECHATGTPVGDAEEFRSLCTLWQGRRKSVTGCVLGSVKSNIGHGLTSAGAAGLAKLLMAFEHRKLPPTAGFETPRRGMELEGSPFRVLSEAQPWHARDERTPRRAALSGFGFGGINAHLLVEEYLPRYHDSLIDGGTRFGRRTTRPVAILGFGGRIADHEGAAELANALVLGMIEQPTLPNHWFGVKAPGDEVEVSETSAEAAGLSVEQVRVPIGRFRIPPSELAEILPQQALILNAAHEAAKQAGWFEEAAAPRLRTAVLLGVSLDQATNHFQLRWSLSDPRNGEGPVSGDLFEARDALGPPLTANRVMGNLASIAASRLAREFRLGGPSFTVSEGPDAGLTALEMAYDWIADGLIDEALVGAVDLTSDVRHAWAEWLMKKASEGVARNGRIVLCDSALAVVLRRSDTSEAPSGSATMTIERTNGETPFDCPTFGEAFAGDQFIGGASHSLTDWARHYLAMRARLEPAAGIGLSSSQLSSEVAPRYWFPVRSDRPRAFEVPAVSQNAVIRVSAAADLQGSHEDDLGSTGDKFGVFLLDATSKSELIRSLETLRARLEKDAKLGRKPAEAAASWRSEHEDDRPIGPERIGLVLYDLAGSAALIDEARGLVSAGESRMPSRLQNRSEVIYEPSEARSGQLAFVFPGMGNTFAGMGRELSARWPSMFESVARKWTTPRETLLPGLFWDRELPTHMDDHHDLIFGQAAIGVAVSDFVRSVGIEPEAMIGLSLGESVSLLASETWRDRDSLSVRMRESSLFRTELAGECQAARRHWGLSPGESVDWVTVVVPKPIAAVRQALEGETRASILIVNSPIEVVVGGQDAVVSRVLARLNCRKLPVGIVSTMHAALAESVRESYEALHTLPVYDPWPLRLYSVHFGCAYRPTSESAAKAITGLSYQTVDFARIVEQSYVDGIRTYVEIGPGSSCTRMIQDTLRDRAHRTIALTPSKGDPIAAFAKGLIHLYVLGYGRNRADWTKLFGGAKPVESAKCVTLPVGGPPIDWPTDMELPSPRPRRLEWRNLRTIAEAAAEAQIPTLAANRLVAVSAASAPFENTIDARLASAPEETPTETDMSGRRLLPTTTAFDNRDERIASMTAPSHRPRTIQQQSSTATESLAEMFIHSQSATVDAHAEFQRLWSDMLEDFRTLAGEADTGTSLTSQFRTTDSNAADLPTRFVETGRASESTAPLPIPIEPPRSLSRELCLTYGRGPIAPVFGEKFAAIDAYPTRVRLPDEPLMLVDRVTAIEGEPLSMTQGRIVTEHDVFADDWYLDCGRVPVCIAVESGQADLMLSGYLGIDFETKGLAVYRLLDATVVFHDHLPQKGEVIVYDIRIMNFFRQDKSRLFRFAFDATVGGKPLMTMRDGCAGFFTPEALAAGQGIVRTTAERKHRPGKRPEDWRDLAPMRRETYSVDQVDAIRRGDFAAAFGPDFAGLPLKKPVTLPQGRMRLVDRVTELDPTGGRFGLGLIRGEFDIVPEAWFMVCHFVDDRVMPGTLMYECCLHTLRIFLMRMGWVCEETPETALEPIPGVQSRLRCRGQVLESTKTVTYEIEIKELGYGPEPYCIADALMYADGKPIVDMRDMSLKYTGVTREMVESLWSNSAPKAAISVDPASVRATAPVAFAGGYFPSESAEGSQRPARYSHAQILEFAEGSPSLCFGKPYEIFDRERRLARLPRPPFNFLHRVTEVSGEPFVMKAGVTAVGEYDVHADDWYFAQERTGRIPFTVLQEAALQVCGWLSSYVGSALTSPNDLAYRNLGGSCIWHKPVFAQPERLTTTVKLTNLSNSAGMIIQHFRMDMVDRKGEPVYSGTTYFGFFDREALKNQIGIRGFEPWRPSSDDLRNALPETAYPTAAPLPGETLQMIDRIVRWIPNGGPAGLGHAVGETAVRPESWFFDAHFYQDPVVPGSLGLEAFVQLMKVEAMRRWGSAGRVTALGIPAGTAHEWEYRGQVVPTDRKMTTVMNVVEIDETTKTLWADGHVEVDGRYIYRMKRFAMRVE